jgi:hypothetical protein
MQPQHNHTFTTTTLHQNHRTHSIPTNLKKSLLRNTGTRTPCNPTRTHSNPSKNSLLGNTGTITPCNPPNMSGKNPHCSRSGKNPPCNLSLITFPLDPFSLRTKCRVTHDQIENIPPIEIEFCQGLRAATGELIMKDASDFVRIMDTSPSLLPLCQVEEGAC